MEDDKQIGMFDLFSSQEDIKEMNTPQEYIWIIYTSMKRWQFIYSATLPRRYNCIVISNLGIISILSLLYTHISLVIHNILGIYSRWFISLKLTDILRYLLGYSCS